MRALLLCLALSGCTTSTEIRFVRCEVMDVYADSIASGHALADSVVFSQCDQPSWEGTIIRRRG